jgi:hypothetical protein
MVSELYRYSNKPERVDMIPEYLVTPHQTTGKRKLSTIVRQPEQKHINIWEEEECTAKDSLEASNVTCTEEDLIVFDML